MSLLGRDPVVRVALIAFLSLSLLIVGFFAYWYVKYDRIIEQRFRGPAFSTAAKIFAAPHLVRVGAKMSIPEIAAELRHAGYSQKDSDTPIGSYRLHGSSIEVLPGPESYHSPEPATISIANGAVSRGTNALMFDSFSDFTPAQERIFRDQLLGGTYQYFLQLVARQRHMTVAQNVAFPLRQRKVGCACGATRERTRSGGCKPPSSQSC